MSSYLVEVQDRDGKQLSQGTGWFLRQDIVVTALHVVGKVQPRGWAHNVPGQGEATYSLVGVGTAENRLILEPLCYDAQSDIALLKCAEPVQDIAVGRLAEAIPQGADWYADGYPGFNRGKEWTLSGKIVRSRGDRLQLLVAQGTQVSWGGISGSPVYIERRVTGLITAETSGTNTAWATAAPAIAKLAATYDAWCQAAVLLSNDFSWNTDRETLLRLLENQAVGSVPEIAALRDRVHALGQDKSAWTISDTILEDLKGYGIGLIREGFQRLVRRNVTDTSTVLYDAWDEFDLFFADYYRQDRFGGRAEQLMALDTFVESSNAGYFFITGPAGLGKTALLVEWLRCLRARGEGPAFHFITSKPTKYLEQPYTESASLRCLCMQLLDLHRLGGELPREPERLRRLYAQLLSLPPPPDERVIVILDGLDEALRDWTPGPGMFPRLAQGVHVVFSARPVANRDWLKELRLDREEGKYVRTLGRLSRTEVADVLSRSGAADRFDDFPAILDAVVSVTQGDPDYVADVMELLGEQGADVEAIGQLPEVHSVYLRQWWDSAYEDMREFGTAFEDLMGTLSVLREALSADDIAAISDADQLSKKNIDTLLRRASRYLDGDRKHGYRLGRSRLLDLVAEKLDDGIPTYRMRVAEFCRRWGSGQISPSARRYGLRNGTAHLLEIGRFEDTITLLSPEWVAAKWQADGAYIGLLDDLERLVGTALAEAKYDEVTNESGEAVGVAFKLGDPTMLCQLPALAIAQQTARELMADLPIPLVRAWVRLGDAAQVVSLLDALPEYRGRAAQQLVAVAEELLESRPRLEENLQTVIARLVSRALGMLHLVRTSAWKLERLQSIVRLLSGYPLGAAEMLQLTAQARGFAEACEDDILRACAFGLVAQMAGTVPATQSEVRKLIDVAEQAAAGLQSDGDRIFFWSCGLPALRQVTPARVREVVCALLAGLDRPPGPSSMDQYPVEALLKSWNPAQYNEQSWAVPLLLELAEVYLSHPGERPHLSATLLTSLIALGRIREARALLERITHENFERGAFYGLPIAHLLAEHDRDSVLAWISQIERQITAHRLDTPSQLAPTLVALGQWDNALRVLAALEPRNRQDPLVACLERVASAPANEAVRISTIRRLMDLTEDLETEARAELEGEAARNLANLNVKLAREYLGRGVQRSLASLPEGSADTLRHLWAVLLTENGRYSDATRLARECEWKHEGVLTCADLISAIPPDQVEALKETAEVILENTTVGEALLADVLCAACDGAAALPETLSAQAKSICDAVVARLDDLGIASDVATCALSQARTRMKIDPAGGRRSWDELMAWLPYAGLHEIGVHAWSEICRFLGSQAPADRYMKRHLRAAAKLLQQVKDPEELVEYQAPYAASLASIDMKRAVTMLEALTAKVEELRIRMPDAALSFIHVMAELTGGAVVNLRPWTATLSALALVEPKARERLRPCMRRVIDSFVALDLNPRDLISGALEMVKVAAGLPSEESDTLYELVDATIAGLSSLVEPDRFVDMVQESLERLSRSGHAEVARRLLHYLPAGEAREDAEVDLNRYAPRPEEAAQTPFERAVFHTWKGEWLADFLHQYGRDGTVVGLMKILTNEKRTLSRYDMLDGFAPALMLPVRDLWGVDAVGVLVKSVLDFDQRFIKAAALIAARA
jgi:hypothetical protein